MFAKIFEQINKPIKQDWAYIKWSKDNKINILKSLARFVKTGKQNKTKQTSYLTRVTKY